MFRYGLLLLIACSVAALAAEEVFFNSIYFYVFRILVFKIEISIISNTIFLL